jgi:hypothetical protein
MNDNPNNRTHAHWLFFAILLLMVVASLIGAYLSMR